MNKLLPLSALLLLFTYQLSFSQDSTITYMLDPGGRIREHNVDFTKMALDVKLKPQEGKVIGDVKYEFKPIQYIVDTLFLNAPAIDIKKVLLNGRDVPFTTNDEGVTIKFLPAFDWNKTYKLELSYEATPRKGMYFIGWNVDTTVKSIAADRTNRYYTRSQVWTQGQGTDNRYWFPCYDDVNDKMVTETSITFLDGYTVISNGVLKSKVKNADGTVTWHYAMSHPMVPYLVMVGIDKYGYKDYKSKNGIVTREYYYADHPEDVNGTYRFAAEMMDWLSSEFQVKFPWETYCNVPVQDFMYGAMENTTATVYGDFYLNDERGTIDKPYYGTDAHELTHQWFGDYITEYSAQHHWLHESFATYYSKQFLRTRFGEDYYEATKRNEENNAVSADRNDRFPVANSRGGSARHYPKGSFVIDMLRYTVGDSVFRRCIINYLLKHAYSNVTNHDFMMAFMETAGVNLDWFFDEWVFRSGFPYYDVNYERQADRVVFYVKQLQKTDELEGLFKMPIVFEVHFKDGSASVERAWISHAADTVFVNAPAGKEVDYTLFDPGSNIIKTITFNKSYDELVAQAEKAPHMIDRYDALVALKGFSVDKKRDFLISLFEKHNFHVIQSEILSQLSADRTPATLNVFKQALHDKDFLVRRSAVDVLGDIPDLILPDVEGLLTDSSYGTVETTLRKLANLNPAGTDKYLEVTKGAYGYSNNVRITWLEMKIRAMGLNAAGKYVDELVGYSSNRFEFHTRTTAMDAILRLGICNNDVVMNLFNASLYVNNRLNGPAQRTLKALVEKPENKELAKGILAITKWKDWERSSLENLLK